MHGLRLFAAVCFSGFIASLIYAANTGLEHPGNALVGVLPYGDKLSHMVLWGVLTFLVNLALRWRTLRLFGTPVLVGTAVIAFTVVVEELSQGFISQRTLDGADLLADFFGIAIATVAGSWIKQWDGNRRAGLTELPRVR